jgi:RNA polymerase sigma-70 factor (ECF subfamily)
MNGPQTTRVSLMARLGDAGTGADASAWPEFVRIYAPHVIHWCRAHGLQDADAHDVSQDVLVKVWRQATSFRYDPSKTFRGYLRRVVLTSVCDWADQSRRQPRLAPGGAVCRLLDDLPAREDLVARLERAYDTELLATAMQEVEQRVEQHTWAAFQMLALEHRSGADVAARLGMQVNTAYVARKKVQRMIRDAIARLEHAPAGGAADAEPAP